MDPGRFARSFGFASAFAAAALVLVHRDLLRGVPLGSPAALAALGAAAVGPSVVAFALRRAIFSSPRRTLFLDTACAAAFALTTALANESARSGGIRSPVAALAGSVLLASVPLLGASRIRVAASVRPSPLLLYGFAAVVAYGAHRFDERAPRRLSDPPPAPGEDRPSMVLVTMDTVRRDRLGLYGHDRATSSVLERLAEDSIVYEDAIAPSSWTLPSHASIFTGLLPALHGAHDPPVVVEGLRWEKLRDEQTTVAERLSEAGYETAAFVANAAYLQAGQGIEQGFQLYDDRIAHRLGAGTAWFVLLEKFAPYEHLALTRRRYRSAGEVTDAATDWLSARTGRPFFLFVNYMDAHAPYWPPLPWRERFEGRLDRFVDPDMEDPSTFAAGRIAPEVRRHVEALYDGGVAYVDSEVGRLVDGLRARGWFDRTWLVVTSDHGEMLGEHDLLGHGMSLHEELLRVPLLVRPPGGTLGERRRGVVSLASLAPLFLAAGAGEAPPPPTSGADRPRVYAEAYVFSWFGRKLGGDFARVRRAVYSADGEWKLVQAPCVEESPPQLFDRSNDPREERNVASEEPGRLEELSGAVRAFSDVFHGADPACGKEAGEGEHPDDRLLRELGYAR